MQNAMQSRNAPHFMFRVELNDTVMDVESGLIASGTIAKHASVEIDAPDNWDSDHVDAMEMCMMTYLTTFEPTQEEAKKFAQNLLDDYERLFATEEE